MRLLVLAVALLLAAPAAARADAVVDWNQQALTAILSTGPTAHGSTREFAMVHGAMYDAVNSIDRRHRGYLRIPRAPRWASQDAAAATAAFKVLKDQYPAQEPALQTAYNTSLAKIQDGRRKAHGIAAGEAAAAAMLDARKNDGKLAHGAPYPFPMGTAPGEWRLLPPVTVVDPAWWVGNVKPFMIPKARWFRTDGPNPLWSRAYARDFNEVKEIGSLTSTTRTADQTMAAIFWQAQPIALYSNIMRDLSTRYGLSPAQNARLFGSVALTVGDAAIACWNDKYERKFWRPLEAVRLADTDGNPATIADPAWKPLFDSSTPTTPALATPNFPDHPSGHGCNSSAAAHMMEHFFGRDRIAFSLTSPRFPNQPRHFESFTHMLEEIVDARVWGGIHFREADEQGAELGESVARFARWSYFR